LVIFHNKINKVVTLQFKLGYAMLSVYIYKYSNMMSILCVTNREPRDIHSRLTFQLFNSSHLISYENIMASQETGEAYEQQNVHKVYQEIAQHFSATRYKVCLRLAIGSKPLHLIRFPAMAYSRAIPHEPNTRCGGVRCRMW
jgi:hypothetical protein